jgi:hypothetical protein
MPQYLYEPGGLFFAWEQNKVLPSIGDNLLTEDIVFESTNGMPKFINIYAVFGTTGILSVKRTTELAETWNEALYSGAELLAMKAYYIGGIPVLPGDTVNLVYSATGDRIKTLVVYGAEGMS